MKQILCILFLFVYLHTNGQTFIGIDPFLTQGCFVQSYGKLYGSCGLGQYQFENFKANKAKIGVGIKILDNTKQGYGFISIGINRNFYWNVIDNSDMIDLSRVYKTSIDLLCAVPLTPHFWFFGYSDIINWETCLGIGYKIQKTTDIYNKKQKLRKI